METAYISEIAKGQSFVDFVLRCARSCEQLNHMRDEPLDTPLRFAKSNAAKYSQEIAKLKEEIDFFSAMSDSEFEAYMEEKERAEEEKRRDELAAFTEMQKKVFAWKPPTSEHKALRAFMWDQLMIKIQLVSICLDRPRKIKHDIICELTSKLWIYERGLATEPNDLAKSNKWIQDLLDNLGLPSICALHLDKNAQRNGTIVVNLNHANNKVVFNDANQELFEQCKRLGTPEEIKEAFDKSGELLKQFASLGTPDGLRQTMGQVFQDRK